MTTSHSTAPPKKRRRFPSPGFIPGIILPAMLFVTGASAARAWNAHGHRIIAASARRALDAETRSALDELLRHHPDASKWDADYDKHKLEGKLSRAEHAFMQASVWPDQIRRKGNPHDHPTWHYIDHPLTGPDFALKEPGKEGGGNILDGIDQSERVLSDPAIRAEERAVHLAWLLHLMGDLHQPLHCATWVDERHPKGDMGGNKTFIVMPGRTKAVNLHSFMDGALGGSTDPYSAFKTALQLPAKPDTKGDPRTWSIEGRSLALKEIYSRLPMPGQGEPDRIIEAGESFGTLSKSLARAQAVTAASRLAGLLSRIRLR